MAIEILTSLEVKGSGNCFSSELDLVQNRNAESWKWPVGTLGQVTSQLHFIPSVPLCIPTGSVHGLGLHVH